MKLYGTENNEIIMKDMFTEFDFNEKTDYRIEEVNGVKLPADYLEFMHQHNGGEGCVGENLYMQLYKLEEYGVDPKGAFFPVMHAQWMKNGFLEIHLQNFF